MKASQPPPKFEKGSIEHKMPYGSLSYDDITENMILWTMIGSRPAKILVVGKREFWKEWPIGITTGFEKLSVIELGQKNLLDRVPAQLFLKYEHLRDFVFPDKSEIKY